MSIIWNELRDPKFWTTSMWSGVVASLIAAVVFEYLRRQVGLLSEKRQRLVRFGVFLTIMLFTVSGITLTVIFVDSPPGLVREKKGTASDEKEVSGSLEKTIERPRTSADKLDLKAIAYCDITGSTRNQSESRSLYCAAVACYGEAARDEKVTLLGEWLELAEASLSSCNLSDRQLLIRNEILARVSHLPSSNLGSYNEILRCSENRLNLISRIELISERLQVMPNGCMVNEKTPSSRVTSFVQKVIELR
jgi:hypothetical protein